jgi:hypothetical protein
MFICSFKHVQLVMMVVLEFSISVASGLLTDCGHFHIFLTFPCFLMYLGFFVVVVGRNGCHTVECLKFCCHFKSTSGINSRAVVPYLECTRKCERINRQHPFSPLLPLLVQGKDSPSTLA